MLSELINADCFDWFLTAEPNSIHAVVTDPPYGIIEFSEKERTTLKNGDRGGVWRIPPSFDGANREPLPRFTILSQAQKENLKQYMKGWATEIFPILVPGAHVCIAGNTSLSYLVQTGLSEAGFEVRSPILRLYAGLRGGDRPKLAEKEYPDVCVTPRGGYEPWMLFRKPIEERTVAANLRRWGTGGLRRLSGGKPLPDVIQSSRTPSAEVELVDHPTIKPQHFLRIIVRAMLPCGTGTILDTFAGSGSTLAAASAVGYKSIGIELDIDYYNEASSAIPLLARMYPELNGNSLEPIAKTYSSATTPKKRRSKSPQQVLL